MSDAEVIDSFRVALVARGIIPPPRVIADGRIHRCDRDASFAPFSGVPDAHRAVGRARGDLVAEAIERDLVDRARACALHLCISK
jgi:hypothetical protein